MRQLYRHAPPDFRLVDYFAGENIPNTRPAGTMPEFTWPDGRWCLDVMLFLHGLLASGCEHEPRGGTLGTYSAYLSPLVRRCFEKNKKNFLSITDGQFSAAVKALYESQTQRPDGTWNATNNRTTVRRMAFVWLDFLSCVGESYADPHFVGASGRIRAEKVQVNAKAVNGKAITISTWRHRSIQSADPYHRRPPLRDSQLKSLRAAVHATTLDPFIRRRRLVMLELFDVVGLRRIEAHLLRVSDVELAIQNAAERRLRFSPGEQELDDISRHADFFSFRMRKQHDNSKDRLRHTPISAVSLQYFKEYLTQRRLAVKGAGLKENGSSGPFFVNLETGQALTPNFFTQEFSALARSAGIREPCSPHMARGRFITRELVRLIRAHHLESMDDFRRALLNSKVFLEQVREISGHASAESLEVYINLAFAEVAELAKTLSRVEAQRNIDAAELANQRYQDAVRAGEDRGKAGEELSKAISALWSSSSNGKCD